MTTYTVPLIMIPREDNGSPAITAGDAVTLERELGDRQSIRVISAAGQELGHIHRQSAKWIADRLDNGKYLEVRVAPLVNVEGDGRATRVQLTIYTEPHENDQRSWWRRLFGS